MRRDAGRAGASDHGSDPAGAGGRTTPPPGDAPSRTQLYKARIEVAERVSAPGTFSPSAIGSDIKDAEVYQTRSAGGDTPENAAARRQIGYFAGRTSSLPFLGCAPALAPRPTCLGARPPQPPADRAPPTTTTSPRSGVAMAGCEAPAASWRPTAPAYEPRSGRRLTADQSTGPSASTSGGGRDGRRRRRRRRARRSRDQRGCRRPERASEERVGKEVAE